MAYTTINKSTDNFRTKTYTGNATNDTAITWDESSNMQPDFLWFKNRSQSQSHALFDVIRGADKRLISNSSGAEGTEATNLDSFDTNGFTVDYEAIVNGNNDNMVTWGWKANGAGSSNTDGDITSTVSVNQTAGFSIVKFTGNGSSNQSIGHGLGAVPKMIILKQTSGTEHWAVYHVGTNANQQLYLNLTNAQETSQFGSSAHTSSVFYVGSNVMVNGSGSTYIAYCFADKTGYSKFGSYTGNGSSDGTFVYTGFKPSLIIQKNSGATGNWILYDNKRDVDNVADKILIPNSSSAEATACDVDLLSNGFKFRAVNDASSNKSGNTYIYMAFAEAPLVGSNGVTAKAR